MVDCAFIKCTAMKTHFREIMIYYNPDSSTDRATVAHARSLSRHVKGYAFAKAPSTGASWQTILKALNLHPKELFNKADPYYQENLRGRDFDEESWIKIIQRNPHLLRAPIAMRGNRAIICKTPTDIYRLT